MFAGLTNSSTGGHALRMLEDAFFEQILGARRLRPEPIDLPEAVRASFTGTYENEGGRYDVRTTAKRPCRRVRGRSTTRPSRSAQPTFEVTEGEAVGEQFDFPLEGFGRFSSRLAERVAT